MSVANFQGGCEADVLLGCVCSLTLSVISQHLNKFLDIIMCSLLDISQSPA